jgi:hypothetical protein
MSRRSTGARLTKYQRAGLQHFRQGAGVIGRVQRALGNGAVTGGGDKGGELAVGHSVGINREAIDTHLVCRRLFRVVGIGSHPELARLDPHHVTGGAR